MASLLLRMPAEDAAAVWTAIDAAARRQQTADPGDKRTLDQVRADVLAGLGWSALTAGHLGCCHPDCAHVNSRLGRRRGRAACVNVTVAYTTLIGADDQPAHLEGYGPIGAEAARRIAAHGVWRRILTDPASGAVLDVGRERYVPPPELAEHVSSATKPAASPPAPDPPTGATWTTASRSSGAAPPLPAIWAGAPRAPQRQDTSRLAAATARTRPILWTAPTGHTYEVDPEIVGLLAQPPPADQRPESDRSPSTPTHHRSDERHL